MKRDPWINVALLAAVGALALFAYFKPHQGDPEHRLSALKAADARHIRIEIAGSSPIALERAQSEWRLTAPFAARADSFQAQRLLEILEASSKDRFTATGLARFDLNEPYARLIIDQQAFSFGAVNPMSREQYVLTQQGIHLVSLRYGAALPKNALQLASKQLFAAEEAPVAFEFREFRLSQQDGKWRLTPPPPPDVGPDDVNRWVDAWRLATALAVQPRSNRKPLATINVKLKDGGDVTLSVLQTEPELIIARSDQPFEYQFAAAVAQRLLAPPAAESTKQQPQINTDERG
ncbi:MAG: DUF4340 domain-containing protein [Betaproteobacteria bacterium]|nr:DUF4340 domain-containing protein [Betaproteobacteria bacterium]